MSYDERVGEFWSYLLERELIRQRRLAGLPREQWTQDHIFREYSFTNVKREHDRTTMLLRREFYEPHYQRLRSKSAARVGITPTRDSLYSCHPDPVVLLNAAMFRFTGTIECARALGWYETWDRARFEARVGARMACGETTFTDAYIVPNCGSSAPKHEVVSEIIDSIWSQHEEILWEADDTPAQAWQTMCERLCELWGVGPFMAKEVLLDYILATGWRPYDWKSWTPVGPGARRGCKYLMTGDPTPGGSPSENETLLMIRSLYAARSLHWPPRVDRYELPALDLTDIQFALCELAKYKKVGMGYRGKGRRFRPTVDDVTVRTADSSLVDEWVAAAPMLTAAYDADPEAVKKALKRDT